MERGREGRRGGAGGGAVSAPRRPRTIGFKDASVGEDGDDIMDDAHNQRLRERPKKETSSLHSVQGLPLSSLASVSRSKRKRQGSQEVHDQARSSTVDDVDETTEDTEMDVSDDDDDPPPPPLPRRSVKFRPQGKFLDDGLSADLPAVPRKARTAILKRPQEASSVSVIEASSHQGSAIHRAAPPSSAPSSSSVVSLKPGRRTKPISSKPRASKVSKMSTQTLISEQEVEVAEALFDLARMFTNQPISASLETSVDAMHSSKPNMEPSSELEVKFEPNSVANFTVASSSLPLQSSASSAPESIAVLCVTSSQLSRKALPAVSMCSPSISTALPPAAASLADSTMTMTSPRAFPSPPPIVVPPAEAPKRKRPRFKTRSDEGGSISQVPSHGISAVACSSSVFVSPSSKLQSEQISNCVTHPTDESVVKVEISARISADPIVVPISMTSPCIPTELPTLRTPVLVQRYNSAERRSVSSERLAKVEVSNSSTLEKTETPTPAQKLAPALEYVGSPQAILMQDMEPTLHSACGSVSLTSFGLETRYFSHPSSARDEVETEKVEIVLKVPPLVNHTLPPETDITEISGRTAHDVQEQGPMALPPATPAEDLLSHRDCENEIHRDQETWERDCEKKPDADKEKQSEREREQQKQESEEHNRGELSKERDMDKEWGKVEFGKHSPEQTSVNVVMADSRTQNLDRTGINAASGATTCTAPSFLLSTHPGGSSVASSVSSCGATVPMSVGMAGWPLGLPPVGYYSSGAAVAANLSWPGGGPVGGLASVDEHIAPAVQLQHPYLIQARQAQPWKRCASHVYIAHFIDAQQQMNRHPFMQAAYQNSASLFGAKSYNLNIPLSPAEVLFGGGSGGSLGGGVSGATAEIVVAGSGSRPGLGSLPGNDMSVGTTSVTTNALAKERLYVDAVSRKQVVQQLQQPLQLTPNLPLQARPGFGFPVAQVGGGVGTAVMNGGVTLGDPDSGGASALVGLSSGPTSSSTLVAGLGSGAGSGVVVSHATAQAQYLQAVMQQGAFPFPFQAAAHFGPGFSGPGHQQAAQYFSSPFYATHLVHTASHTQQQMQNPASVSAGVLSNDLQHPQQKVARNFPPATCQQQQQSIPPAASPSLSQQAVSTSQQMQRLAEREGNSASESNSTIENKFPLLQRNVFTQGSSTVTPSVTPSSSMLLGGGAGMQCLQPQDFNLLPGLGGKPAKQLHQNQLGSQHLSPLQQQQQHGSTGAAIPMSLKGTDQQSSHTFSPMPVVSMTRASTIGPGPLGLAPVAPVMAPQGHAMLQSVTDSGRGHVQHQQSQHHQSVSGQSNQLSLPSGQQHQRAAQMQRGATLSTGVEDGRAVVDGTAYPIRSAREPPEERKMPPKRGNGSALNLSRVDLDSSAVIHGSSTCGGLPTPRMSSSASAALNLLTPTSAILISRSSGHSTGNILQQTGPSLPLLHNSKQAMPRSKLLAGSGSVNSVTSSPSQLSSLSERPPLGSSVSNKVSGPTLSSPGQGLAQGSQVARQGQASQQHTQLKLSNRGSLGSLPTPTGTAPQAVLAAAIAKSQQGVQQQQSRSQTHAGTSTGPLPRIPSGNMGALPTSSSIPLRPLSPAAKSLTTVTAKINSSSKGSFSVSQRPPSAISVKRSTPPSGPNVTALLGPTLLPSTKSQQQPSQNQPQPNSSQHHTQLSQQPPQSLQQSAAQPPQSITPTHQQYHHQQAHVNSQQLHQMHNQQSLTQQQQTHHMQRQLFIQNPTFQQHQHAAGPQLSSHPQQQAGLRQQAQQHSSQVQTHQQANSSSSQLQPQQRHSSPQLHHQQQHGLQGGQGTFSVGIPSGSLSLGPPLLTLGTGCNGKVNNSSWTPGLDGVAVRSSPVTSKGTGSTGTTPPGPNIPRSQCGAPSLPNTQFGSGQQPANSPRSISGAQYLQPVANSGGSGVAVDEVGMAGVVARKAAEASSQPKL